MIKKDSNSSKQVQETLIKREKPPKRDFSSLPPISEVVTELKSPKDADFISPDFFSSETEPPGPGIQSSALELENADAELWHQQLEILNSTLFRLRLRRKHREGSDSSVPDTSSQPAQPAHESKLAAPAVNKANQELPTLQPNGAVTFGPMAIHLQQHPEAMRIRIEFSHSEHDKLGTGTGAGAESVAAGAPEKLQALHVYGLGEKMGRMDRTGRVWEFWNTDDPDHLPSKDPLYVSIPFAVINYSDYYKDSETDSEDSTKDGPERAISRWYGLFIDMPARQYWDVCRTEEDSIIIDAEDTYMNAYIFTGKTPRDILSQYTALTGRMPLPPIWALGYHQSRYSYESAGRVKEIIDTFRSKEIPLDTVHLDIDYMNGYRVFTWDPEQFLSPFKLARYASDNNVKLVTIVDPGVKADEQCHVYTEGREKNYFCKNPDGGDYLGKVWPGISVFPDFSQSAVQSWWADLHARLFEEGVSGIWNDMNEPADFTGSLFDRTTYTVPDNLLLDNDGSPVTFSKYHNLYANGMNRACRTAVERHLPGKRGFILSRAGYAGIQKYAALWTGDNHSWWEHLSAAVSMLMGISISGVAFVGADAGGFQENASPELFTRWFQFAVFTPFFRGHTANDTGSHEPWCFGKTAEAIIRHYGKLRYALLPYIYTQFYEASRSGEPIMKPLFLDWPNDPRAAMQNETYLFGSSFLIRPVTKPDTLMQHVYLPEGIWYDFWNGKTIKGPRDSLIPAAISRLPIFIRGGSIIPHEAPRQSSQHRHHDVLELDIYPDAQDKACGSLYMDAEEGFSYVEGAYTLAEFSYSKGSLHVKFNSSEFTPPWQHVSVTLHSMTDDAYAADSGDPGISADPKLARIHSLPVYFAGKLPGCTEPLKIPFQEGNFTLPPENPAEE